MVTRILLFCTFLCLVSLQLDAQEIKLKKGQEFIFESEQNVAHAAASTHLYKVYAFKVKEKDPSGNYLLEGKLLAAKQKSESSGRSFAFDSDSISNTKFNTTAALVHLALLQRPFHLTLSPKGKVIDVKGVEESLKEAAGKWELKEETSETLVQNGSGAQATMQRLFFSLPQGKGFKEGLEWTNSEDSTLYRVTAAGKSRYTITASNGGSYTLERKTSLPLAYTMEFGTKDEDTGTTTLGSMEIKRLSTYDSPSALDTAWVNMGISSSFWSTKLQSKGEYDSLKVIRFIEKYEKLYAKDPVYVDNALRMMQQADMYEEYGRALKSVPNTMLMGSSSHLHNKLQGVYGSDPEAAFEIVKLLDQHHPGSLYNWVQHSFSQAFLGKQTDTERKNLARELLVMCMYNSDESLRGQFAPLSTWVAAKASSAKANKAGNTGLENIISEIRRMNAGYWTESNLGRYALLTYQLLEEAGGSAQAGKLLDYTLLHLEEAVNDSLNKHQLAHRNMLAYAYFLKYQNALPADSLAALDYLKKAADYSPKSSAEKAHGSFYDRVFLNSRESYQGDYMVALSRLGRSKDALAAIVAEFNANPHVLPKLKAFYRTSFPDKDFKTFFAAEVVSKWEEAPSFTLSNLTNQPVSLKNYAGKWLVIDFWGTWCGPCKEEMPEINSFYQKIEKGAVPGVDFLSIACYDTKEKVVDYLTVNNFDLPAVLSDGKIQEIYKIKGYPTKVLVSPDGKMKTLRYGTKWETIVEQFNSAYPGEI